MALRAACSGSSSTRAATRSARRSTARPARRRRRRATGEHARGVLERIGHVQPEHLGPELVQAELERRHDAEVAAAAAQRPEQVGVLVGARAHTAAVGEDDLGGDEVVDRHAVAAALVGDAAVERQPGDAGLGDDPAGGGQAKRRGHLVDVGPGRAALNVHGARGGVEAHAAHLREIDDQAVVAHGSAGHVVPTAANGERQLVLVGEAHGGRDVVGVGAARDDGRIPVDHPVPDAAGVVVVRVARGDDVPLRCSESRAGRLRVVVRRAMSGCSFVVVECEGQPPAGQGPSQGHNAHERFICATPERCAQDPKPTRIRIVATPDSSVSPVIGMYETLQVCGAAHRARGPARDGWDPFDVEIVAESAGAIEGATGLVITAHRGVDEVTETDVVIVPSMAFGREGDGPRADTRSSSAGSGTCTTAAPRSAPRAPAGTSPRRRACSTDTTRRPIGCRRATSA